GDGRYVSDAFVRWSPEQPFIPWCGQAPQSVPPATRAAFINQAIGPAQASMKRYGVPASVTIAQAILESGTGASTLTRVDHSLFGMKCFGSPGPVALGCRDYATHECNTNGCWSTSASFRAYGTQAQSFADHGLMLASLSRYDAAFAYTYQPDKFAQALQTGGYATSKSYAKNLITLMKQYNLYRYDLKPPKPVSNAV
ncbi:MAG TPA: sporangiospore maturation cell wall hydrolase GsmA, partial [Mycobacterium sp.]|nr:sporangiospore maturation cell wall hydrolase GsmA [Mycobacterium sp.]